MADNVNYFPSYSFSGWQANNPTRPLPAPRIDEQFVDISNAINQNATNLGQIRRSDGGLRNGIVGHDQLSPTLSIGFRLKGEWEVGQIYDTGDGVVLNGVFYSADEQHLSTPLNAPEQSGSQWTRLFAISDVVVDGLLQMPVDVFTGDGFTTSFPLPYAPMSKQNLIVTIGGIPQPVSSYNIEGFNIVFLEPAPLGYLIEVRGFSTTAAYVVEGSVETYMIKDGAVTSEKLAPEVVDILESKATAVSYLPQELTDSQKVQARSNIEAEHSYNSVEELALSVVPDFTTVIRVNSFYKDGLTGIAYYGLSPVQSIGEGKTQSLDGKWWELASDYRTDAMYGGESGLVLEARGGLGGFNTKIGLRVGRSLSGARNLLAGYNTGHNMTTGYNNVLIGHNLGSGDTIYPEQNQPFSGHDNIGIGYHALKKNQNGNSNIGIGGDALNENYTGNHNVAIGQAAGQQIKGSSDSIYIGSASGGRTDGGVGLNTFIGRDSGRENKNGERSTLIGWGAGRGITPLPTNYVGDGFTTTFNVPGFVFTEVKQVRVDVAGVNTLPSQYTVSGTDGVVTLTTPPANGASVVLTPTIGSSSHSYTVAVGMRALTALKSGDRNTVLGAEAGLSLDTGQKNLFIGAGAANSMTSGNGNIIIGSDAYRGASTADNKFIVANQSSVAFLDGTMAGPLDSGNILTIDAYIRPAGDNTRPNGSSSRRWANTFSTNFKPGAGAATWTSGSGAPEGVISATPGSFYTDEVGGVGYIKKTGSGNTGWKLITQAA